MNKKTRSNSRSFAHTLSKIPKITRIIGIRNQSIYPTQKANIFSLASKSMVNIGEIKVLMMLSTGYSCISRMSVFQKVLGKNFLRKIKNMLRVLIIGGNKSGLKI